MLTCDSQGRSNSKRILATRRHQCSASVKVFIEEEELVVAPTHQFFAPDHHSCISAKYLRPGQEIFSKQKGKKIVRDVKPTQAHRALNLIDISVEDNHNFYVSREDVLVHNFITSIFIPIAITETGFAVREMG